MGRASRMADSLSVPLGQINHAAPLQSTHVTVAVSAVARAAPTDEGAQRVTVWNPSTGKKLSGNAGVMKRNLAKYLASHPDWVVCEGPSEPRAAKRKRPQQTVETAVEVPTMADAADLW